MKLYVCWGLFRVPGPGHPCRNAWEALTAAGHEPEIVRCYGWGLLPRWMNRTRGRRAVRRLTGRDWVPALTTEDGAVVAGSGPIRDWAARHSARTVDRDTQATATERRVIEAGGKPR